jgi:hypothetical protein
MADCGPQHACGRALPAAVRAVLSLRLRAVASSAARSAWTASRLRLGAPCRILSVSFDPYRWKDDHSCRLGRACDRPCAPPCARQRTKTDDRPHVAIPPAVEGPIPWLGIDLRGAQLTVCYIGASDC